MAASAFRLFGVHPIQRESHSPFGNHEKNFERTGWLFHKIQNHYLNSESQQKVSLDWGANSEALWEPCRNVLEKVVFRRFAPIHRAIPDQ